MSVFLSSPSDSNIFFSFSFSLRFSINFLVQSIFPGRNAHSSCCFTRKDTLIKVFFSCSLFSYYIGHTHASIHLLNTMNYSLCCLIFCFFINDSFVEAFCVYKWYGTLTGVKEYFWAQLRLNRGKYNMSGVMHTLIKKNTFWKTVFNTEGIYAD